MIESERLRERLTTAFEAMPDGGPRAVLRFLTVLPGRLSEPLQRVQCARDALRLAANMVDTVIGNPLTVGGVRRWACRLELAGDLARYGAALLAECGYREDLARKAVVLHAQRNLTKRLVRPLSPPCPYDLQDEELKEASAKRRAKREAAGYQFVDEDCPPWPSSSD